MSRRLQENIVAGLVLFILLGVIYLSWGYGPRARMVPIPVAVFGVIMMVIQIIWQNLRPAEELHVDLLEVLAKREKAPASIEKQQSTGEKKGKASRAPSWRAEAIAYGMVVLFTVMIYLVGPIPAIFVFTAGYFLLSRHYTWGRALVYTAVFTAAIYLLFAVALDVQLYHGLLEPIFSQS
jgi:hypothetical protein